MVNDGLRPGLGVPRGFAAQRVRCAGTSGRPEVSPHALAKHGALIVAALAVVVQGAAVPLHHGADAVRIEMGPQRLAPTGLDLIALEDVEPILVALRAGWQRQVVDAAERAVVMGGDLAPARDVPAIGAELVLEDRGLDVIEPAAGAPADHPPVGPAAMIAQQPDLAGELVVIGDDRPGIAETAERTGRIEAEGGEGAGVLALVLGTQRLVGVFEQPDAEGSAIARIASMSQVRPLTWVRPIPAVRSPTRCSIEAGLTSPLGSISASTGVAPTKCTAEAMAMSQWPGRMISSPTPMPAACSPRISALVPSLTPNA